MCHGNGNGNGHMHGNGNGNGDGGFRYFERKKKTLQFPILNAIKDLLRYYLGSVAFGSLIVTIMKVIRQCPDAAKHMHAIPSKIEFSGSGSEYETNKYCRWAWHCWLRLFSGPM